MIFETHAHYDDEAFDGDREQLLCSLPQKGIARVINVGASIETTKSTLALAENYDFMYAAVGVHPSDIADLNEETYAWLKEQTAHPKTVAVGKSGWTIIGTKSRKCRRHSGNGSGASLCLRKRAGFRSSSIRETRRRIRCVS